jgi:hypothetical protein
MGTFPVRNLVNQIFSRIDDTNVLTSSSPESAGMLSPEIRAATHKERPGLAFDKPGGELGMLQQEADHIHTIQQAMILLYAVINPDSEENKKQQSSAEKVIATITALSCKDKKKKKKSLKFAAQKFKRGIGKSRRGSVSDQTELFSCKRGCGFQGEYDVVADHEEG